MRPIGPARLVPVGILFALPLAPLPAQDRTQSGPMSIEERFRRLDRDGDGRLTPRELPRREIFERLDRDGDGIVTKEEVLRIRRNRQDDRSGAAPTKSPTHANVAYGPHERNVLDFWKADTDKPAPVVVYIHGGGFVGGDKSKAHRSGHIQTCLDAGVHYASINYRFRQHAPIQEILRDAGRAIQFIRSKAADWNVDRTRIAAHGGSAGAGTSLWLASHDDLADPASGDPVLRESSRLAAAGCQGTQATYDLLRWEEVVGPFKPEFRRAPDETHAFYHFKSEEDLQTEKGKRIRADCDMLGLLSKGDPPVFVANRGENIDPRNRGEYVHHVRHALAIKKRCDAVGVECVLAGRDGADADVIAFCFRHLGVASKSGEDPAEAKPAETGMIPHRDLRYAQIEGVAPNLLSLDLYAPATGRDHPVMVMIHGGGWRLGDKAHAPIVRDKAPCFTGRGYLYASINYRLSPAVTHPVHVQDVAKALAWIVDHAAEYGGDPGRIFVMGHSAGAHLAALVATDDRRLKAEGKDLSPLRGVVLLDGAGYDIPKTIARGNAAALYRKAFTNDEAAWKDASPLLHVAPGKGIPPFLIVHAGNRAASREQAVALAATLRESGVPAETLHAPDKDHGGINACIGTPGDPYTKAILRFLDSPERAGKS